MSVLASNKGCSDFDSRFSKELFTEINNNLKVFTYEEWKSIKDNLEYKKLLIAVYVRTDIDNLVLLINKDKFANVSNIPPFISSGGLYPNILLDAGLVCGKSLIDQAFTFKSVEAMKRLVSSSTCYPVGVVETSKKFVLVFNVILSESLLRDREISLNQGFHFCPIETLQLSDSLQKDISDSLVIVKSEDKK